MDGARGGRHGGIGPRHVGGNRPRQQGKPAAEALGGLFLVHRRTREAHRETAQHATAVADGNRHAVQARGPGRHGEGMADAADALQRRAQRRFLARRQAAQVAQNRAPLFLAAIGEPDAAQRARQHRPPRVERRALERHGTFGGRGMADGDGAVAQGGEVERPAML